jgi:hypothetical protein
MRNIVIERDIKRIYEKGVKDKEVKKGIKMKKRYQARR